MNRIDKFGSFKNHHMLKKSYKKLNLNDLDFCIRFLNENAKLDKNEIATKIVRLYIDKEKPKNWKEIEELLISSI